MSTMKQQLLDHNSIIQQYLHQYITPVCLSIYLHRYNEIFAFFLFRDDFVDRITHIRPHRGVIVL